MSEIEILIGKTLKEIKVDKELNEIWFYCETGETYKMLHYQYCCEVVEIEEIIGDIENLI